MVRLVAGSAVGPQQRIDFEYDAGSRRIRKKVWNNTSGTGTPATDIKFLYQGWNLIAELNALSSDAVIRSFVWGNDLSGTFQGAGGVVNEDDQRTGRRTPLEPVVGRAIDLYQLGAAGAAWTARMDAGLASLPGLPGGPCGPRGPRAPTGPCAPAGPRAPRAPGMPALAAWMSRQRCPALGVGELLRHASVVLPVFWASLAVFCARWLVQELTSSARAANATVTAARFGMVAKPLRPANRSATIHRRRGSR